MQQWIDLGANNQHWQVDSLDREKYRITSMSKVIDSDAGSSANGAKTQEWEWANNVNQKWKIEDAEADTFMLSPAMGAVLMSLSMVIVAINARLLKLK